jgi:hypothetical protein
MTGYRSSRSLRLRIGVYRLQDHYIMVHVPLPLAATNKRMSGFTIRLIVIFAPNYGYVMRENTYNYLVLKRVSGPNRVCLFQISNRKCEYFKEE